jgi:non-heme chloroperoxidase
MDTVFAALLNQDLPALRRDLTEMQRTLGQFAPGTPLLPPLRTGIEAAVDAGFERYTTIHGPVLAVFAVPSPPAGVGSDAQATQQWLQHDRGAAGTFARGVPQARVIILPNANHFVFNSNPAEVLSAMRAFIDALPRNER